MIKEALDWYEKYKKPVYTNTLGFDRYASDVRRDKNWYAKLVDENRESWEIYTSGTTGEPKKITHSLNSLTKAIKVDRGRGQDDRWGLVYSRDTFAGLQVIFQSLLNGSSLLISDVFDISHTLNRLEMWGCTALSATPTFWRMALLLGNKLDLRKVTLGGEIVTNDLLVALKKAYPKAKITHIYATTETGVVFLVNDGLAGFPDSYVDGQKIKIEDNCLVVNSHNTGDVVERVKGRYYFKGRIDNIVNIGGMKVSLESIESRAFSHPCVSLARAIARASSITGKIIQLDVIPCDFVDKKEIASLFDIPVIINFVDKIDTTPTGKIQR